MQSNETSSAATSATSTGETLGSKLQRWSYRALSIATVVVVSVVTLAQIIEHVTLPDCDSERASKSLIGLAKDIDVSVTKLSEIKTLPGGQDETQCSARADLPDGLSILFVYSFFWDGWTVKGAITKAE